jgi:myxalamid-type polyketide synthase MxaE and MxaD
VSPERIDPLKPLGAMGLSSLLALELRNHLESALERPLSATLTWNHPNLDALVRYLAGDERSVGSSNPIEKSTVASSAAAADLSSMSDAEAARLLRRKRSS